MQATLTKVEKHNQWWNQEVEQFARRLEKAFKDEFPQSAVKLSPASLGYGMSLHVTLGNGLDEYHHRISRNDPMWLMYQIWGFNEDGTLGEKMTIESVNGGSITVAPKESHFFCSHLKVFRKISGNSEKLILGMQKHFAKLRETVIERAEEMQQFIPVDILEKLKK